MNSTVSALLLDISGVLYDGAKPIAGATKTIEYARNAGFQIRFVTNTASKSADGIVRDLAKMGISIRADELFTAPFAARDYVEKKGLRPYVLLHENVLPVFDGVSQENPNAVVLGDARDALNYENLNKVFRLCKNGAPLIAVGMNKYFSHNNQLQLDAGPFVYAIEWASACKALIMGKPSNTFFLQAAASTGFSPHECLMVGDDVQADVLGAVSAGLQGCLVQTGKYRRGDEALVQGYAHIISSIVALPDVVELCHA